MDQRDAIFKVKAVLASQLREDSDVESLNFDVTEFPGGWLIFPRTSDAGSPHRGSAPFTVDRQDGSVRRFSSAFPPGYIIESYDELKTERPALE